MKRSHTSELSNHSVTNNHQFDFDNVKILAIEKNLKKRLFLEMLHINKNIQVAVNKLNDIDGLSNIYTNIM